MKKLPLLFALFFFTLSLQAYDFGLVFQQNAEFNVYGSDSDRNNIDISGILIPRFTMLTDTGELYVSIGINYFTDPFAVVPELTRTDYSFSLGAADIKVGRTSYSDPTGIIANNLFDGARASFITNSGNFHAGAFYTGAQYKKRAAITMTYNELKDNYSEVDYGNFADTYFAPSRIFAAIDYDHPSIAQFFGLNASIIAQFDAGDEKLNSQYFTAGLSVPVKSFIIDAFGCLELIEYNDETKPAFAADLGVTWIMPFKLEKQLRLSWRYSSGVSEDEAVTAFLPITTVAQGELLQAKFSALSYLCLDFTGRFTETLSANAAFRYFIRNDLGSYKGYPVIGSDSEGYLLGAELSARAIWNISTGIRLNVGTGVFLPSIGNAAKDEAVLWRTDISLVLSIY